MRTCGNAPPPSPRWLPGRPNSLSLAGVSAASQHEPSTAISRRPCQNAPGVDGVASGRAVAADSTRNGSAPSRFRARDSDDLAGSRRRCSARSHAATTRSTKSGGYTQVNTPSPDSSGTPSATGTTPTPRQQPRLTNATALVLGPHREPHPYPRHVLQQTGGQRSHSGADGPTYDQRYVEARRRNIRGRSSMNKAELKRKLGR
jgi:hypothetical protein